MATVTNSIEAARGCGYRKPGGIYLVGDVMRGVCYRLPHTLTVCACCGAGIKPSRGWTWVNSRALNLAPGWCAAAKTCHGCFDPETYGLIWIGESFYKTPAKFIQEAAKVGVSRRIASVPKGFKVGATRILLAHKFVDVKGRPGKKQPGIFAMFTPKAIEYIVTGKESPGELDDLEKRGFKLVKVTPADKAQMTLEDQLTEFTIFYRTKEDFKKLQTMKMRSRSRETARINFKKSFHSADIVSIK